MISKHSISAFNKVCKRAGFFGTQAWLNAVNGTPGGLLARKIFHANLLMHVKTKAERGIIKELCLGEGKP